MVLETANASVPGQEHDINTAPRRDITDEEKAVRAAGVAAPRDISGWRWALAGELTS